MKNLLFKLKCNIERKKLLFLNSNYDFLHFNIGSNSLIATFGFVICVLSSVHLNILNWDYLKGISNDLSFLIGFFSVILGIAFYNFWNLGERSIYCFHFARVRFIPEGVVTLLTVKGFTIGISSYLRVRSYEIPPIFRQIFCVGIFFLMSLMTIDIRGINTIKELPTELSKPDKSFCPEEEEETEMEAPKAGCALILRAFKLGYAKDLGECAPKEIEASKREICLKRRQDEPYLHFLFRKVHTSVNDLASFFDNEEFNKVVKKFEYQVDELEVLKDYQSYAISASPRASHHIWTNLPYPNARFFQFFKEIFDPNYCLEEFQNQTNTIRLDKEDERKYSKLLEHIYGQLLFNPKVKITVGFCKEYKIHWNSTPDSCDNLIANPENTLRNTGILADVDLVLRRHEIANIISDLDDKFEELDSQIASVNDKLETPSLLDTTQTQTQKTNIKKQKKKIDKSKIAKNKQQIRKKHELVSFQCFMQSDEKKTTQRDQALTFRDTEFSVKTRLFPKIKESGESQISMYQNFSKLLEESFHYTQYSSRSDIKLENESQTSAEDSDLLQEETYILTRLETLKNLDIFLGNNWILERDDLLEVYPFHVHLKNYVERFRIEYDKNHGRL